MVAAAFRAAIRTVTSVEDGIGCQGKLHETRPTANRLQVSGFRLRLQGPGVWKQALARLFPGSMRRARPSLP